MERDDSATSRLLPIPKRGAVALGLTALALALLLNFQVPSEVATVGSAVGTSGTTGTGSGTGGGTAAGDGTTGTGSTSGGGTTSTTGTVTIAGPSVMTRFGAVQVQVTVDNGRLTDITALQLPDGDRRSSQISSVAEPQLRTQALSAQSANIDGVSGATYTSIAYARSLQAALDDAGLNG